MTLQLLLATPSLQYSTQKNNKKDKKHLIAKIHFTKKHTTLLDQLDGGGQEKIM